LTFVIIGGGIDLSVGSALALVGVVMAATVDQHPEHIGAEGVRAAAKLLKGENIPAEIPIQVELIIHSYSLN
jgi:ribose transport system substrate-binding protein